MFSITMMNVIASRGQQSSHNPTPPLCFIPPSSLPAGGGGPSGGRPALGVWGGVCVSQRGAVLPLQGPLGAAPGYAHVGEHQVREN